MTDTPERALGWCTAYEANPGDPTHPKYWYLFLHTSSGHYRIGDLTFPTEHTVRKWATHNLPGLPEYE